MSHASEKAESLRINLNVVQPLDILKLKIISKNLNCIKSNDIAVAEI